jgi:hypothetical protein
MEREKKKDLILSSQSNSFEIVGSEECLFCLAKQSSLETRLSHMNRQHGFFIRSSECVIDLGGLLEALSKIVNEEYTCLHCY